MPIWILLVAVVIIPMVVWLICTYIGTEPLASVGLPMAVSTGPIMVLLTRSVATWTGLPAARLAAWTEWILAFAPSAVTAMMIAWALWRGIHDDRTAASPVAWCARCDTALYTDHVGRFYSMPADYLCPPELRTTGERRHQAGDTATYDRHR